MTDDLRQLQGDVPPARDGARRAAIDAGLAAFDTHTTQGKGPRVRLRDVLTNIRRYVMPTSALHAHRPAMAVALVATLALPVTIFVMSDPQGAPVVEQAELSVAEATIQRRSDAAELHTDLDVTFEAPASVPSPEATISPRAAENGTPRLSGAFGATILRDTGGRLILGEATRERFAISAPQGFQSVAIAPVSTFSVDVDTASYARIRRAILAGQVPSPDMVRSEEVINAFPYDDPAPDTRDVPFRVTTTLTDSPWTEGARLLRIGIKGYALPPEARPRANLVFLIDASGSMNAPDKLPLLKRSLEMLLGALDPDDTVAIVTYAGNAGIVLNPTPVRQSAAIRAALANIGAGGGTAGAAGIEAAYALAADAFIDGGSNRVILATDGDFNVGASDPQALERLIAEKRDTGIFLSILGFGTGNLRDDTMQALAQAGNGVAAYIDTLREARRVLVDEADSALFTIARDVKIQMEFNPAHADRYRLIGYETRALAREDFADDRVDAGEIGAGHTVTALYEILPAGTDAPLRYSEAPATRSASGPHDAELGFLKIRYKTPDSDQSRLIETAIRVEDARPLPATSDDTRFAVAAAAFAQKLRGAPGMAAVTWDEIAQLARGAVGADTTGQRRELVDLIELVEALSR